jgi:hypothetical protein
MLRRAFILLVLAYTLEGQNAALPLEAVGLKGTGCPHDVILRISGLHIGGDVNQATIEAAGKRLEQSGLFASIEYRYAPGPKHGYVLTLTLVDQNAMSPAVIDIPGYDDMELWHWLISTYPSFDHRVPQADEAQRFLGREIERHLGDKLGGQHIVTRLETDLRTGRIIITLVQDSKTV